jgi:hypothetical protein
MTLHSTVLIPLVLLLGATVPCLAEEGSKQNFTCTAKAFNDCLMEAPCSAWKRLGPKDYKLETKIIFRGNPVEGETISGGTMGDVLETNAENSRFGWVYRKHLPVEWQTRCTRFKAFHRSNRSDQLVR